MWRNSPTPPSYTSSYNSYSRESSRSPDYFYRPYEDLKVGDRVIVRSSVGDAKTGILQFLGKVDFAEGAWAGVELFYPQGRNDGTVLGVEYFRCKHPYGIFVPLRKVDLSPVNNMVVRAPREEGHDHQHCGDKCEVHDRIYWNTEAVIGNRVTGVRNPAL